MKSGTEYRVGDVAKLLATSDQSVRSWSNEFRALLGPGAVPDRNVERRYTAQDVQALALIQQRKRLREDYAAIADLLQTAIRTGELPDLPDLPLAGDVPASVVSQARETWMMERAGFQTTIDRLEADRAALEARIEVERALSQQRLADEQAGRRGDLERLLREIGGLQAEIARLKAQSEA
jgi:DNA-binding transcriptional MerR regulator